MPGKTLLPALSGIVLLLACVLSQAAEFPGSSRVLVIYGNPDIGPWEQNFNQIILESLATEAATPVIPEFLDLIQASEVDQQLLAESLNLKYSRLRIDLVIAVLPEANSFVYNWAEVFAPEARILHVIPGLDVSGADNLPATSKIIETALAPATEQTLELITRLLPETSHLYVVGGSSEGDLSYLQRFEEVLANTGPEQLEYTVLRGLTPTELLEELAIADANSAILMSTYDRDHTGEALRTMAMNFFLAEQTSIPIFSVFDSLVNSGSIGGNVSSSSLYANTTSRIAIEMLQGDAGPGLIYSDTGFMFNGSLLDRYDIDRSLLPDNSIIVQEDPSLWREYFGWIVGGLLVIAVQLALIALLIIAMQRQRAAESQLKKVQRMEALGSLSGGIAHDFNNILMSIMANAELVNMSPDDQELVKARTDNILHASDRAKDLIAQILMFSRQSASFDPKPLDINSIISTAVEQLRSFVPQSCIVEFEGQQDLPMVKGEASILEQVIMNICVNARHAIQDDGFIHITSEHKRINKSVPTLVSEVPVGDYVLISITDNGTGIKPEDLQHVFEPFFTTKPRGKGTGLGLSLVYQMIKGHEGFIDIKSSPDKGTTALIYLPCSSDNRKTEVTHPGHRALKGHGECILLVDDDEMVLDANKQTLQTLGYSVEVFSSSTLALEEFRNKASRYALVFTDLSMPEMDGVRLIASIRQLNPAIPAIICTGYADNLEDVTMENLRILKKPSSAAEIAKTVQEALAHTSSYEL